MAAAAATAAGGRAVRSQLERRKHRDRAQERPLMALISGGVQRRPQVRVPTSASLGHRTARRRERPGAAFSRWLPTLGHPDNQLEII